MYPIVVNKLNKCKEKAKIEIIKQAFTLEIEEDQNAIERRDPCKNQ